MRASRLLSILILLQLRARLTAEALADEFEVSVRTIYRDIDALSAAGVPVYGDRGPGGGFALLDGYRTKLTGLASDEAEAMLMIGMPGPATALGLGAAAGRARGKLTAALGERGAMVDRIAGLFHLDPVDWYRAAEPVTFLPTIARALLDQRSMSMTYESWNGVRDRIVDPIGLVQKGSSWYMVGRVGEDLRTYRVSMIRAVAVLEQGFERPKAFDLAGHWETQLARFETDLRQHKAHIRVSPLGRRLVSDLGAYGAQAISGATADEDGWTTIDLSYEDEEQGARLMLGLGPEVEVLAPQSLRDAMRAMLAEISLRLH